MLNNYKDKIINYINDLTGTGYLAIRDVFDILKKFSKGNKILDFGCGAGRSTRFLKNLGYVVDGVDINMEMLKQAQKLDPYGNYFFIDDYQTFKDFESYDIVFNLFVLFEFEQKNILISYLKSLSNCLNPDGIIVSIVNSNFLFTKNWLTINNDFPENAGLKCGDVAKISLPEQDNITLYDHYWSESGYIKIFQKAGLEIVKILKPLGKLDDPYNWKDELNYPPYSIYVCSKKK